MSAQYELFSAQPEDGYEWPDTEPARGPGPVEISDPFELDDINKANRLEADEEDAYWEDLIPEEGGDFPLNRDEEDMLVELGWHGVDAERQYIKAQRQLDAAQITLNAVDIASRSVLTRATYRGASSDAFDIPSVE